MIWKCETDFLKSTIHLISSTFKPLKTMEKLTIDQMENLVGGLVQIVLR